MKTAFCCSVLLLSLQNIQITHIVLDTRKWKLRYLIVLKLTHKPFSNDPLSVFQVMFATLKKMKVTSLKCLLEALFMMSGSVFFFFFYVGTDNQSDRQKEREGMWTGTEVQRRWRCWKRCLRSKLGDKRNRDSVGDRKMRGWRGPDPEDIKSKGRHVSETWKKERAMTWPEKSVLKRRFKAYTLIFTRLKDNMKTRCLIRNQYFRTEAKHRLVRFYLLFIF